MQAHSVLAMHPHTLDCCTLWHAARCPCESALHQLHPTWARPVHILRMRQMKASQQQECPTCVALSYEHAKSEGLQQGHISKGNRSQDGPDQPPSSPSGPHCSTGVTCCRPGSRQRIHPAQGVLMEGIEDPQAAPNKGRPQAHRTRSGHGKQPQRGPLMRASTVVVYTGMIHTSSGNTTSTCVAATPAG